MWDCRSGSRSPTVGSRLASTTSTDRPSSGWVVGRCPSARQAPTKRSCHALEGGRLTASTNPSMIKDAEHVVITLATDVDLHLNPDIHGFLASVERYAEHFLEGQLLVSFRSTVFPGVTRQVEGVIERMGKRIDVAFCPERIAEGHALPELRALPQLVGARLRRGRSGGCPFSVPTPRDARFTPEEAELAKLFSNTWRYVEVRHRQPALHDRERLRRGLRDGSFGDGPVLPARR